MNRISICVPTYNRFDLTIASFAKVLHDPRVSEIIIVDDCSTDDSYSRLVNYFLDEGKVIVYRNEYNLDCYLNKKEAISKATNEWCVILDSDNIIDTNYIDKLYTQVWNEHTIYAPDFAKPHFNYTMYDGVIVDKFNVCTLINKPNFECMLNTMNYFVHKGQYLQCFDSIVNPHTSDSIYQNYRWLLEGNKIYIVPGLQYDHLVHDQSHYTLNQHKTGNFHNEVLRKINQLCR